MRKLGLVVGAVLLVLLGAGVVYASIPDVGGVIHGCRKNSGGDLRVIDSDAGQTCMGNETALNWRQEGLTNFETVQVVLSTTQHEIVQTNVSCPTGKRAISAGYVLGSTSNYLPTTFTPASGFDAWVVQFTPDTTRPFGEGDPAITVNVVCARTGL